MNPTLRQSKIELLTLNNGRTMALGRGKSPNTTEQLNIDY